ncbi:hypothetical protein OEZ84_26275, partial [Leclercia adecarboxylata]|uniref:hypothetical protein n=1 Tax=Leclercia adecarboxylata TaxID=83655 RepID=UPI00234D11FD
SIEGTILSPVDTNSTVSVEWLKIENPELDSLQVVEALGAANVGILPGNHFYWHQPSLGSRYVRIALARECGEFMEACKHLSQHQLLR